MLRKKEGPTRIRTGVVRIRTESDNHYTIEPLVVRYIFRYYMIILLILKMDQNTRLRRFISPSKA